MNIEIQYWWWREYFLLIWTLPTIDKVFHDFSEFVAFELLFDQDIHQIDFCKRIDGHFGSAMALELQLEWKSSWNNGRHLLVPLLYDLKEIRNRVHSMRIGNTLKIHNIWLSELTILWQMVSINFDSYSIVTNSTYHLFNCFSQLRHCPISYDSEIGIGMNENIRMIRSIVS